MEGKFEMCEGDSLEGENSKNSSVESGVPHWVQMGEMNNI